MALNLDQIRAARVLQKACPDEDQDPVISTSSRLVLLRVEDLGDQNSPAETKRRSFRKRAPTHAFYDRCRKTSAPVRMHAVPRMPRTFNDWSKK